MKPLTPVLQCHLTYEEPPQRRIVNSTLHKVNREFEKRERTMWQSADAEQLVQLHQAGGQAPSTKIAIRLQKALIRHEARVQRDAAKAVQQAEVERRRVIREERAKLRAERQAAAAAKGPHSESAADKDQSEQSVLEPATTPEPKPTPEPQLEPLPEIIDYKLEILVKQIQAQRSVVAA